MSESPREAGSTSPRKGWILYDGECGFCFRWVHVWEKFVKTRGFALKDLQSASAEGRLSLSPENLLDDILILTPGGTLESGANAYLFLAREIWWAWPFYAIFRLPGLNWMLGRGYRWFNRHRYRFSSYCRLPAQTTPGPDAKK
jgi:predicted DCC family thiol-disulfide oxidoreductase YuxK